ncbi:Hint domain-containing protein [Ruegeria sediminis]|uniref:Hint domain-containing protein n=1 Tax=Ruegeria sediminis TaxID=2583820 RepID=A0ABY2WV02_9RHOB|nr:Hint domain-containing protein [Ruegeria sediminis]TMV05521.1 Hint domain-containing protein [Ruegeria sediminis]
MPTSYTDQFYLMDPANPPPAGTNLTVQNLVMIDQNDDGDIDRFNNDRVNGSDVQSSWPGDTITINVPGVGNVTYTGTTFYLANGQRVFTPTDGKVLQDGTFVSSSFVTTQGPLNVPGDLGPPCFTPGTMIRTPDGERAIEDLQPGDLVETVDSGPQPVLWIGRTRVAAEGKLAPVRFEAGVLGLSRPLLVSPQHRMLIDDWRAEYFFGFDEVLVAAHSLVNGTTVTREEGGEVEYIHLLFADHEMIVSNGAISESYFPGHALSRSDRETQAELLSLFPELTTPTAEDMWTVRPVLRTREARLMAI